MIQLRQQLGDLNHCLIPCFIPYPLVIRNSFIFFHLLKGKEKALQNSTFTVRLYIHNTERSIELLCILFHSFHTDRVISEDIYTCKRSFSLAKLVFCCQRRVLLLQRFDSKFMIQVVRTASSCYRQCLGRPSTRSLCILKLFSDVPSFCYFRMVSNIY